MSEIIINGIKIDYWESGHPYWFHIRDGDRQISFTHRDAYMIGQALCSLAKKCKGGAYDKEKDEFGI